VGYHLVGHLVTAGCQVTVCDVNMGSVKATLEAYPGVEAVEPDENDADFAPVFAALADDLNTPLAIAAVNALVDRIFDSLIDDGQLNDSPITIGAWRAPYTNFLGFAEQSFFDELAEILEVDVVQLRLDLLEQAKPAAEQDERIQYSPARMQGVIRLAAEKGRWGKPAQGVYQGFSAYYSHNTHVAELAEVVLRDGKPVVQKVVCAVDCGIVVNPDAAKNQVEGAIIDGLGHAMYGELTFNEGVPSAGNFDRFRLIRSTEVPRIETHFVESDIDPTGLGEPALPPAAGAVANALYRATDQRLYKQPFLGAIKVMG